jgi:hypothetical protein
MIRTDGKPTIAWAPELAIDQQKKIAKREQALKRAGVPERDAHAIAVELVAAVGGLQ